MARRSGLGKGLGALIPTEARDRDSALRVVPMTSIKPNPLQPRTRFDEEAMSSLASSIREVGVLQPILVRETERGRVRAHRRRAPVAGGPAGRAADDARPGPERLRCPQPRAGTGGEPPPRGPQPARGGRRLPTARRRVRLHPRAGRLPGGQEPHRRHQYPPAAPAPRRRPAGPGRRRHLGRPRPGAAGDARPQLPGGAGQADRGRGPDRPGRRGRGPPPRPRGPRPTAPRPRTAAMSPRCPPAPTPSRPAPAHRRCAGACPRPGSSSSRISCPTTSTPGSRSRWGPSGGGS